MTRLVVGKPEGQKSNGWKTRRLNRQLASMLLLGVRKEEIKGLEPQRPEMFLFTVGYTIFKFLPPSLHVRGNRKTTRVRTRGEGT